MHNSMTLWAGLCALTLGLSGCLYQDLEVLSIEDFSAVRLSWDGMSADMVVDVFNPNPYAVTVTEADVRLRVQQEVVGEVTLREAKVIRPEARASVSLQVQTIDGALMRVVKQDLMNLLRGADVPFVAEGSVTGKAFGLSFSVPIRHNQTLNIRP
ncbi:MAG: LEA type 2 family protein [Bacteroidetes bacterium]|nr:LEA type 2 family protein [Bacteroidota bacterium]MDA0904035.1 LEA type 2 family protein [Bacteroidota bacterium]MDA1242723.1 LEA type 2 family protein [Bacteroidota bacterium]